MFGTFLSCCCSLAVLRVFIIFVSFWGSEWSLVNSVHGMGVFFGLDPWRVERSDSSSGGLQLSGFGGGALVATGCRDVGISVLFLFFVFCFLYWLAVELWLVILSTGLHFLDFRGGSGFSFPWGFRLGGTFVLWT